jgi:hypothetical protein
MPTGRFWRCDVGGGVESMGVKGMGVKSLGERANGRMGERKAACGTCGDVQELMREQQAR